MQRNLLITIIFLWFCFGKTGNSGPLLPIGVGLERGCAGRKSGFPGGNESGFPARNYEKENPYSCIGEIPTPEGYHREAAEMNPFAGWLRDLPLKKDRTVRLYNGLLKRNQAAQFAVLDVSVGQEDLQQCADAVMRLRSEYLYSRKDFINIDFPTGQGISLNYLEWTKGKRWKQSGNSLTGYTLQGKDRYSDSRECFGAYLRTVFSYCGTLSLEKQLVPLPLFASIRAGDVLIKGGAPGHAMLVVDMAINAAGQRIYLLAQSYMPAQDIHIVVNVNNKELSPWYEATENPVYTPEWVFYPGQLRTWPKLRGKL